MTLILRIGRHLQKMGVAGKFNRHDTTFSFKKVSKLENELIAIYAHQVNTYIQHMLKNLRSFMVDFW